MSGETQEDLTPETTDADFDAGFTGTETTTPPAPETPPETPPEPVVETTPPETVNLTRDEHEKLLTAAKAVDELRGEMKRQFDTAFGQVGGLKQVLQKLQSETPQGQAVQVDEEDFADLKKEYPELGELTIKGINKVLGKLKGTSGVDPQAIEQMVGEKVKASVDDIKTRAAEDALDAAFPDWREDVKKPEFAEWLKDQPDEIKALGASYQVKESARMLRAFYGRPAPKPEVKPEPTQAPAPSARQRQIAAAVPPKGDGGPAASPKQEDDFDAGFKKYAPAQVRR